VPTRRKAHEKGHRVVKRGISSPNIIGMKIWKVKSWAEHVEQMGRWEMLGHRILIRNEINIT
jgi:hypothetical protein